MKDVLQKAAPFLVVMATALLLLFVNPNYISVEKRIYSHYTASVVEDLDFNVVNQIPDKEAWLLTTTHHYPDMHSNGVSVLWAPFFALARWSGSEPAAQNLLDRAVQSFTNVFFGLAALLLLAHLLMQSFSRKIVWQTFLVLVLTSPLIWYWIEQPENADITSFFIATALLYFYEDRKRYSKKQFSFFFGLALFTGMAIKFDIVFYGLLFAHFLYESFVTDRRRWRNQTMLPLIGWFALGSALALAPILTNESIKNGYFNYTYFDTATGGIYLLLENLFAPSGYFMTQPFLVLLPLMVVLLSRLRKVDSRLWFFMTIPISEIVLESFNYNHNESFGARHWINDLPLFAVLTATVLHHLKNPLHRLVFWLVVGICSAVSITALLVYVSDYNAYYYTGDWIGALMRSHADNFWRLVQFHNVETKLKLWPVTLMILLLAGLGWRFAPLLKDSKPMRAGFVILFGFYSLLTVFNAFKTYVPDEATQRRIDQAVIGSGPHIYSFFENAGCLQKAVEYYNTRGNIEKAVDRRKRLEDYAQRAASEILRDANGFQAQLMDRSLKNYVSPKLWDEE